MSSEFHQILYIRSIIFITIFCSAGISPLKENASSNSKYISSFYDVLNKTINKSSESAENLSNKIGQIEGSLNCENKDDFPRSFWQA